jgi:hypothetical protein
VNWILWIVDIHHFPLWLVASGFLFLLLIVRRVYYLVRADNLVSRKYRRRICNGIEIICGVLLLL